MHKLMQFLFHPMVYAVFGVVALALLVWFGGPLIAFGESRPFDPIWVRVLVIAILFGLILLRLVWKLIKRKRTNAALVNGMAKGPSAADRELGTLNERFTQAL